MSRTLVVCDNEFLSTLYVMNLEVYLATSVVLMVSAESAIAIHKAKKNFDLIITLDMINKKSAFKELDEYRGSYGVKTPIIKLGAEEDQDIDTKTFAVSSRYNIQGILKKSASILGVTAKKMAELQIGAYYPMSTAAMEGLSKSPCNIYVEKEGQHKKVVWADDPITDELKNLRESGVETIFVKSSDRLVIVNNVSLKLIEKISAALKNTAGASVETKVNLLNDGFEFASSSLFSTDEIRQEMADIANSSSKVMSDVVKESSQLKALLSTMLSNQSGYIFTHSMIASYVANHIMKNVTWGGESQADKINFVLFFHDIYLAPIYLKYPQLKYEKVLLDNPILNEKENYTVVHHARMAAELVVAYKRCPMGADMLIKHHHGMKKGSGFASKYPEDLSPISKVLLVAEAFTEFFLDCAEKKKKVEMKQAIPLLIEEFSSPSYLKIVQTLVDLPI